MSINLHTRINADSPFVDESPVPLTAGDTPTYNIVVSGATTISSPSATMYKDGTADSNLLTGDATDNDVDTITCPKIQNLVGMDGRGNEYVLGVTATINGDVTVRKCMFFVQKASSVQ